MPRRPEHRRETARFWREHRAEAALRERVLVPAEEYERFARGLERALADHQRREEERIQQVTPPPHRHRHRYRHRHRPHHLLSPHRWRPPSGTPSRGSGRRCGPRCRSVSPIPPASRAAHRHREGRGGLCSVPETPRLSPESHSASNRDRDRDGDGAWRRTPRWQPPGRSGKVRTILPPEPQRPLSMTLPELTLLSPALRAHSDPSQTFIQCIVTTVSRRQITVPSIRWWVSTNTHKEPAQP